MRVLIIESDLAFAATLRLALEARGVEVETTADGKRGVELAQAKPTAAVVLSVELGDRLTGGFSWCNKFKREASLKSIPLLLTSSLATEQTFEQHRKLKTRADDYLLKPFGPRELLERLEPYLPRPPAPADGDGTVDLVGELLAGLEDDPAPNVIAAPKAGLDDDGAAETVEFAAIQTGEAEDPSEFLPLDDDPGAIVGSEAEGEVLHLDSDSGDSPSTDEDPPEAGDVLLLDHDSGASASTDEDPRAEGEVLHLDGDSGTSAFPDDGSPADGGSGPLDDDGQVGSGPLETTAAEIDAGVDLDDDFDILAADLIDELEMPSAGPAADAPFTPEPVGPPPPAATAQADAAVPAADNPWSDGTPTPGSGSGRGRLIDLETRLATLGSELEASRREGDSLRAQLATVNTDLAMTKGEAVALQDRVASLESDLSDAQDREALLARKLQLEGELREELRATLKSLLDRLDDAGR